MVILLKLVFYVEPCAMSSGIAVTLYHLLAGMTGESDENTLIECSASPFIPGFCAQDDSFLENGHDGGRGIYPEGGGSGGPLLHGHPQEKSLQHGGKCAATLAQNRHSHFADLRVAMATAINQLTSGAPYLFKAHHGAGYHVMLMDALGFSRFAFT